jgi:hypothetical protein
MIGPGAQRERWRAAACAIVLKGRNMAITFGSIVLLHNTASSTYLDTYGWVANSPDFWNVAGTERIFVSTCAKQDRGGGTTSWQIVSADGKHDGQAIRSGDRVHLRNMYSDAGYLDCCGWVEDLAPFRDQAFAQGQGSERKVRCGVFTSGAANRDNGTGTWIVQSAGKATGATLSENDTVALVNAYPANNQPADSAHAEAGWLVAYGDVHAIGAFKDFKERQQLVFTSTNADVQQAYGGWKVLLSPAFTSDGAEIAWFDLARPETLKGRTRSMQSVSSLTRFLLVDALRAISGVDIEAPSDKEVLSGLLKIEAPDDRNTSSASAAQISQHDKEQQLLGKILGAKTEQEKNDPEIVDYDFQVKQLWNLLAFSKALQLFDKNTLQVLMQQVLDTSQQNKELPPLDLIRSCFRAIASDHELIQRATMQRRWSHSQGAFSQSSLAGELVIMDKLATKAVAPFQHLLTNTSDTLAVITYFSEDTHIHHMPYTDQCILVGINYDRISPNDTFIDDTPKSTPADANSLTESGFASFELLAIPHEVGHYIYQHGSVGGKSIAQFSERFRTKPYYWWCEEIFADVYGCIVAGPLSAFSMQAFLESGDRQRAWNEDNEHPTPRLRPYILSETLRVLGDLDPRYQFANVPDMLDEKWTARLESWGTIRVDAGTGRPARLYLPDASSTQLEQIVNVDRVLKSIREMIRAFASLLLDSLQGSGGPAAHGIPWKSGSSAEPAGSADFTVQHYAREMALLTGMAKLREAVQPAVLLDLAPGIAATSNDPADQAEARLRAYLRIWGDNGPMGSGGGTH